jgi:hypothetical protein
MDPSGSHTSDCWHGTAALSCSCGNGSFGTHRFVALQLPLLLVNITCGKLDGVGMIRNVKISITGNTWRTFD